MIVTRSLSLTRLTALVSDIAEGRVSITYFAPVTEQVPVESGMSGLQRTITTRVIINPPRAS